MKNSSQYAKKVGTLLRKLSPGKPKKEPDSNDSIGMIVYSFFLWESTSTKASASWAKLVDSLVDFNELYNADKPKKKSTRRSRRSKSKGSAAATEAPAAGQAPAEEQVAEAKEEKAPEAQEAKAAEAKEEKAAEAQEAKAADEPAEAPEKEAEDQKKADDSKE